MTADLVGLLLRRLAVDLKKPFFEIMAWPSSELSMWRAHYELEYEAANPPEIDPESITPQESILQFKSIIR